MQAFPISVHNFLACSYISCSSPPSLSLPGLILCSLRVVVVLWRQEANYTDWASPKRHLRWMDELCRGGKVGGGRVVAGCEGISADVNTIQGVHVPVSGACNGPRERGNRRERSWAPINRVAPCHSASHNPNEGAGTHSNTIAA